MNKRGKNREIIEAFTMVLQFGLCMIVPIGLCTALGIWLGRRTGLGWMMIPFFFLGALAGGTSVWRLLKKFLHPKQPGREDVKKAQ